MGISFFIFLLIETHEGRYLNNTKKRYASETIKKLLATKIKKPKKNTR